MAALDVDIEKLLAEGIDLLRAYLRLDTTNPPGDVSIAADFVEEALHGEGLSTVRVGASPEKANVATTVGDSADLPLPFVLAHHMDVVPAVVADWTVDPFGAELRDGYLYGRGVLDMKGFGVLSMLCAFALQRTGVPLKRPLRVIATADEEIGGVLGAKWLAEHHIETFGGEFLLTEGSFGWRSERATFFPVVAAEKGVSTVKLTAKGKPGHASAPTTDNCVIRIGNAIHRIGEYRSPPSARDLARRFMAAFPAALTGLSASDVDALGDADLESLILRIAGTRKSSSNVNLLRNTFTPTMVNAGVGQNVIPATAEAFVDCRSVPGVTAQDVLDELGAVIDDPEVALELVKSSEGTQSSPDTELFDALSTALTAERPDAFVVPYLTGGGTDSKHFRPAGISCYGLIPVILDEKAAGGVHGIDERVSVDNLELALKVMLRVVTEVCVK